MRDYDYLTIQEIRIREHTLSKFLKLLFYYVQTFRAIQSVIGYNYSISDKEPHSSNTQENMSYSKKIHY